jgi:hypothetical protein
MPQSREHTANEAALATEHVGKTPRSEQGCRVRDCVGREHPREQASATEIFVNRPLGDDNDRNVE